MPAKQPVLIGSVTRSPEDGSPDVTTDIIVNVSSDLYSVLGSPVLDPEKLQGKEQDGPNGMYRFPKRGTNSGQTVTLITSASTPSGGAKTYQMQLPRKCPLHVLDKYLSGVTFSGDTIIAFKAGGGLRIPLGQTVVTP